MRKTTALLFAAALLSGCQAHMMETQGDTISLTQLGKEKPKRGGVIRFLNTGLSSWQRARRSDALKQMQRFCAGEYAILAEGPRSQFGAEMPIGKSVSLEVDQYTYIKFECVKQPTP